MRPLPAAAVAAVGLGLTLAVCTALGVPALEGAQLIATAGAGALLVGLGSMAILRLMPQARFGTQMAIVVAAGVGAVTVGVVAAAFAMLLAPEDAHALIVVVLAAGTVGASVALTLAERVRVAHASLAATARRFEDGSSVPAASVPPIKEFATLAADLEATRKRLESSRSRERQLEAARRELMTWLSHDLRTPLAGIRALAEALEDGVASDPETVSRYYRRLSEQAERISEMVEDLFALSRISSGTFELEASEVALGDLLSDAVAAAEPVAARAGVRIEGRIDESVDVEVGTREVGRVLDNLLSNAIRETPRGGRVQVALVVVDGWAEISVADECGGMPAEVLSRAFDPGFRGATARGAEASSRGGFGLTIARGLAEAHGGELHARNVTGGCAFRLRLPLSSERHSERHSDQRNGPRTPHEPLQNRDDAPGTPAPSRLQS